MKLYLYVLAIFANLMLLNALLSIGDYVLSALGAILRADWEVTYMAIVAIYSLPIVLGFVAMYAVGKLIPHAPLSGLTIGSGAVIVAGMCVMFASTLIPYASAQMIAFTVGRVFYVCGFYPMSVQVDYIMSRCLYYYTGYRRIHNESWFIPVSFGMIFVLQTYSDDFGKMSADILLPYLSTLSIQIALSTLLGVSALMGGSIALNVWLYGRMERTLIVQKINSETDDQGNLVRVDFDRFFKEEYSVGYLKALGLLMALTFVWTGIRNGFLLLMPGIWMDLYDMSAVVAPTYVGYGLLASCAIGAAFCLMPTTVWTLRIFFGTYLGFLLPGSVGMVFSAYLAYPLLTAIAVCTSGSLTTFAVMLFVPMFFREADYVMVFVWLEISRGLANITIPLFFGLLFENEIGTSAVVLVYIALSVLGAVLFLFAYGLLEHNRHYAASFNDPAVVSNTENNGTTRYPQNALTVDLDTSFSESEFNPAA